MKLSSNKLIATILVLTMVLSTPGMSVFANSIDDLVNAETAKEETIDTSFEEEKEEDEEETSNEVEEEEQEEAEKDSFEE